MLRWLKWNEKIDSLFYDFVSHSTTQTQDKKIYFNCFIYVLLNQYLRLREIRIMSNDI